MNTLLIIGACGVGKTWVASELIARHKMNTEIQLGLVRARVNARGTLAVAGVYDGGMFQGSDRLSMAVAKDFKFVSNALQGFEFFICEGDRFTNSKFISIFRPTVVRIAGDGSGGRQRRGSNQSYRHVMAVATRVANFPFDIEVADSQACLSHILNLIEGADGK